MLRGFDEAKEIENAIEGLKKYLAIEKEEKKLTEKRFGPKQRTIEENVHLIACDTQEINRTLKQLERRHQIREGKIHFSKFIFLGFMAVVWLFLGVVGVLAIGSGYLN